MTRLATRATVIVFVLAFGLPVVLMIVGSLRPPEEAFRHSGELSFHTFVPESASLDGYRDLLARPLFVRQLLNTVVVGCALATTATLVATLGAFAFARLRFVGREALFFGLIATLFIPFDVVLPPLFLVVRDLGLLDSTWGLVLPFVFSPLSVFLLRQGMQEVPTDLDDACVIDGGSTLDVLRTAIVPNIRPQLAAVWLLNFLFVWEWYLWPLLAMRRDDGQLAQVAIAGLVNPLGTTDYQLLFAGATLAILPAAIVFGVFQRFFVRSVAMSGVK